MMLQPLAPGAALGQVSEDAEIQTIRSTARPSRQQRRPDAAEVARLIVERTNELREEEGLESVEIDQQLSEAAQYFADYMAETNTFGHTADGSRPADRAREHGYDYCLVSENIGHQYSSRGFTADELAKKFFEGWKESAEHRKNMLNRHVTGTGVAVARSEDTGYYFAVQMFGRPKSDSIEFEVANQSGMTIEYEIGGRAFALPPGYTRTHQGCVPEKLVFQWPGEAEPQSEAVEPNDGDRFTVERDPSDGFKVERE
ncbi:MAG: CAP domain-containing protein [Pirellulales bacterium]